MNPIKIVSESDPTNFEEKCAKLVQQGYVLVNANIPQFGDQREDGILNDFCFVAILAKPECVANNGVNADPEKAGENLGGERQA